MRKVYHFMGLWWLMALQLMPAPSYGLENIDALGALPVQHEGRIKPLDTLARLSMTGMEHDDQTAIQLLTEAMFAPGDFLHRPLINLPSDAVRSLLKLPEQSVYSYQEITPKLRAQRLALQRLSEKDPAQLTANEKALWELYERVDLLTQLSGSLSLLLPLELALSERAQAQLKLEQTPPYHYLSLSRYLQAAEEQLTEVLAQTDGDVSGLDADEQSLALFAMRLSALRATGEKNTLLRIIPAPWSEAWLSPWAVINEGKGSEETAALMQLWHAAALSYQQSDQAEWDRVMTQLQTALHRYDEVSPAILSLEQLYHRADVIMLAVLLYGAAFVLALLAQAHWARIVLLLGLVVHVAAIALRVIILARPPVSTLYESVIFVALVAALYGWFLARKARYGTLIGAGLGTFLLSISGLYAGAGDPMAMPIAVLNTNFWLATHVIVITAGYGAAIIAGVLGHLALLKREGVYDKPLHLAGLVALLLTAIGTILGGIWADQSWGRFWGWDPKENGALLIVLWLVWALHSRMTKYIGAKEFRAMMAMNTVIVAVSWFGVNLLGIGLHSYGFTDEAALGFFAFCAAEMVLIPMLYWRARRAMA